MHTWNTAEARQRAEERTDALRERFIERRPASQRASIEQREHLPYGTAMHWFSQWPVPFPIYLRSADGNRVVDIDGNEYLDFCLGDSAALFGHGLPQVAERVAHRLRSGAQAMLPTEEAGEVAAELSRRFGLPKWQFALSATDANRAAIRIARAMTGRSRVLVFDGKYHGAIDELHVVLDARGETRPLPGVHDLGTDFERTTVIIPFNDVEALRAELARDDIAAVLTEPALSNGALMLPEPGFHDELRRLTREHGTLLILDETQTIVAGLRGMTGEWGLEPDVLTLGKSFGGGVPVGLWGMTENVAAGMQAYVLSGGAHANHAGFGGTLAGNALAVAAVHAVLQTASTEEAYARSIAAASKIELGMREIFSRLGAPWSVSRAGLRVWVVFSERMPVSAAQYRPTVDPVISDYLHLSLVEQGILLGPFTNGILAAPQTTDEDVVRLLTAYETAVSHLLDCSERG
ncbi:transaminase [Leucobacter tenebrionis]|uniref:transaminase n=1 Tax=Leucobacter tenebrionis TaxID=2873270 RepID=UPI001CA6BADB|nr:transaminase [Leucobacter tenebrionis]QZY51715.1 aminotransferase class III-fold pyridoxal phosphate-dependent enzyme [Leucobacter tenebrionis]